MERALVPTANLMLNYILKPVRHESFHKKYAGKRYFKVGTASFATCPTADLSIRLGYTVQHVYATMGLGQME